MKLLRMYTDGSHFKHTTGRLGVGGVLVDENNNILAEFSKEVSIDYLKLTYGTSDVSNPTCEMLAVYWGLVEFKKFLKSSNVEVISKADYLGVMNWINGTWKINKNYIQKIKDDIKAEMKALNLDGRITFDWVKGHQKNIVRYSDAYWNDYVDSLSKGE